MKKVWLCLTLCLCAVSLSPAWGQSYPDRPVKLVIPWAPGGIADIMGRLLGQKLSTLWGQPVVIENRPGASSNIGTAIVAKSAPDGYTFLLNTSSIAVNTSLFTNPGYELEKNITGYKIVLNTTEFLLSKIDIRTILPNIPNQYIEIQSLNFFFVFDRFLYLGNQKDLLILTFIYLINHYHYLIYIYLSFD